MRPCENVIVTIRLNHESVDMELPAFSPIRELVEKMDETFRIMFPQLNIPNGNMVLLHNGHLLEEQDTLASRGIWDGSVLACDYEGAVK